MITLLEKLSGKSQEEVYNILLKENSLTPYQKNLMWTRLFPQHIGHMELPRIIMEERNKKGHPEGYLKPNQEEIITLLRAYSGAQYGRFIKHLLHSYIENPSLIYVDQEGEGECTCSICGKNIMKNKTWVEAALPFGECDRKEFLAFSSEETSLCLCVNCILQLRELDKVLKTLDGEDYLIKWKRNY